MPTFNKIWILALGWWLLWTFLHGWFLVQDGWGYELALSDSVVSNILLAALCSGILFSIRSDRPDAMRMIYLAAGIMISAALQVWLSKQLLTELYPDNKAYIDFLEDSEIIRFLIGFFMIALFAMIGWITYFLKEKLEEKNRGVEINRMARESELIHLRQQLQPHFLFNTLNSVSALTISDPEAARKMIHQLSDFLRGTLKKEDNLMLTLKEELHYLELYLEIEKVRFGDRLQTTIICEPEAAAKSIPAFLLQPLVENAIKFGLYDTIDTVNIDMKASFQDPFLIITITNPFDEKTRDSVLGTGFGLNSISRRLYLLFSRNDLMETSSMNGTFTVTIKIPQSHE